MTEEEKKKQEQQATATQQPDAVEQSIRNMEGKAAQYREFAKSPVNWKSHATLTLLAKQDLPTFGYNMIDPLKSWCWGSILFYPFKISRFS